MSGEVLLRLQNGSVGLWMPDSLEQRVTMVTDWEEAHQGVGEQPLEGVDVADGDGEEKSVVGGR